MRLWRIRNGVWARANTTAAIITASLNSPQITALKVRRTTSLATAQAHQNRP